MRKHTVLVIESRQQDNKIVREYLEPDYLVLQARTAEDALSEIKENESGVEAILMEKSGLTGSSAATAEAAKETLLRCGIPVLAVLEHYDPDSVAAVINAGASEILIKPFEKTLLRKRIDHLISSREAIIDSQYDPLTGIYNKKTFYRKTRELIASHPDQEYTVVCLDIERFKMVNDLFGSAEGDRLLQYVGGWLESGTVETGGVVGHIVADVFACCYPGIKDKCRSIAGRIADLFKDYPLNMEIRAAVGFYHIEDPSLPVSRMCDRAIMALNSVKSNYLKNYAIYNEQLRNNLIVEQELVNDMEYALENNEFKVYMQPKCDMDTGKIVGAEALVRWQHPDKGMISPSEFIPVFEENNFILRLDDYVWEQVCIFIREWIDEGNQPIPISVNVSRINLYDDALYERLIHRVETYKLEPKFFELEITESAYASDIPYLTEVIDQLRTYGFTVLMDDFGSGYSSLNMLKDVNVDILKMDMRFLTGESDGHDRGGDILESVVRMAKWLNLFVVAEGVETKEQVEFLLSINCHYAQGFYYYRPMPLNEFRELMRENGKVDYGGMRLKLGETFNLQELIHPDAMSDVLLQNIMGGVAFYEYYQGNAEIIRVNEGYYAEIGCSEEELHYYAKHVSDMVYGEDWPILENMIQEASKCPESGVEGVFRRKRLDGELIWLRMKLYFLSENKGRQLFYGSIRNVTEEKKAEERLRISEERLRLAMKSSSSVLFDLDIRKRTVDVGEEDAQRIGMPAHIEDAPAYMIREGLIHPANQKPFLQMYAAIFRGEPNASCETRLRGINGDYFWSRVTLYSIFDEKGRPFRAVGLAENIEREKELEFLLEQARKKGESSEDNIEKQ